MIQRELAVILRRDARDPRLGMITINDVKVSRDLAFADVYYTVLDSGAEETQNLLDAAAGFFRRCLAGALTTRVTPRLRFHYDASMEYGRQMTRLVGEALEQDADQAGSRDRDGGET